MENGYTVLSAGFRWDSGDSDSREKELKCGQSFFIFEIRHPLLLEKQAEKCLRRPRKKKDLLMLRDNKEIRIAAKSGETLEIHELSFETKKVQAIRIKFFDMDGNMDIFSWPVCEHVIPKKLRKQWYRCCLKDLCKTLLGKPGVAFIKVEIKHDRDFTNFKLRDFYMSAFISGNRTISRQSEITFVS